MSFKVLKKNKFKKRLQVEFVKDISGMITEIMGVHLDSMPLLMLKNKFKVGIENCSYCKNEIYKHNENAVLAYSVRSRNLKFHFCGKVCRHEWVELYGPLNIKKPSKQDFNKKDAFRKIRNPNIR